MSNTVKQYSLRDIVKAFSVFDKVEREGGAAKYLASDLILVPKPEKLLPLNDDDPKPEPAPPEPSLPGLESVSSTPQMDLNQGFSQLPASKPEHPISEDERLRSHSACVYPIEHPGRKY